MNLLFKFLSLLVGEEEEDSGERQTYPDWFLFYFLRNRRLVSSRLVSHTVASSGGKISSQVDECECRQVEEIREK